MSPRLPRVSAADAAKALEKAGFRLARQSGSHRIYRNQAGQRVTLPYHGSRILHPKVLRSILQDAKLTIEEFDRFGATLRTLRTFIGSYADLVTCVRDFMLPDPDKK